MQTLDKSTLFFPVTIFDLRPYILVGKHKNEMGFVTFQILCGSSFILENNIFKNNKNKKTVKYDFQGMIEDSLFHYVHVSDLMKSSDEDMIDLKYYQWVPFTWLYSVLDDLVERMGAKKITIHDGPKTGRGFAQVINYHLHEILFYDNDENFLLKTDRYNNVTNIAIPLKTIGNSGNPIIFSRIQQTMVHLWKWLSPKLEICKVEYLYDYIERLYHEIFSSVGLKNENVKELTKFFMNGSFDGSIYDDELFKLVVDDDEDKKKYEQLKKFGRMALIGQNGGNNKNNGNDENQEDIDKIFDTFKRQYRKRKVGVFNQEQNGMRKQDELAKLISNTTGMATAFALGAVGGPTLNVAYSLGPAIYKDYVNPFFKKYFFSNENGEENNEDVKKLDHEITICILSPNDMPKLKKIDKPEYEFLLSTILENPSYVKTVIQPEDINKIPSSVFTIDGSIKTISMTKKNFLDLRSFIIKDYGGEIMDSSGYMNDNDQNKQKKQKIIEEYAEIVSLTMEMEKDDIVELKTVNNEIKKIIGDTSNLGNVEFRI